MEADNAISREADWADLMSKILAERRADYRRAEWFMLHYDDEFKRYKEDKAEFMSRPADENASRRGAVSHPTESAAIMSVQYDAACDEYQWLRAVDIVMRGLCDSKRIFINLRRAAMRVNGGKRGRGRQAWVVYVQTHYSEMVGRAVSDKTVKRWNSLVIRRIVDVHLRLKHK